MTTIQASDQDMERIYRLVPSLGHTRAIAEVAGEYFDQATDQYRPFTEMQAALTERYGREMAEFSAAGGY